ncbi:uncharacterized protein LOC118184934 [Stegodyphus dumicola]|uniref:uncharacterized protein LOC118184934 n=1 Tax=Stegodyphus dumicola TaxID=202533 RepID=UPI0015ACF486|nr:uncharacterized protein LOC118184934 [Stegodyphus dumicola]
MEMSKCCLHELKFKYFLPGKIQTDTLEARFGKYRSLAGSQYLISVRQVYEAETELRLQNFLPLTLNSSTYGKIKISSTDNRIEVDEIEEEFTEFDISITEKDFEDAETFLPVLTYLSGYCARAALKKLKCNSCFKLLVTDKVLENNQNYSLIKNMSRGGLLCPRADVVTVIMYNYVTVQKLLSVNNEQKFLKSKIQRQITVKSTLQNLKDCDVFMDACEIGHSADIIIKYLVMAATNSLLNNYCKKNE